MVLAGTGLEVRSELSSHNARSIYRDVLEEVWKRTFDELPGCRCGEMLRGLAEPDECPLFGKACTPMSPVGPCMVSSEGGCAIAYKHGKHRS